MKISKIGFSLGLAVFSAALSIIAISLALLFVSLDSISVTYSSLISAVGLIITCLAFTVGSYFAFIAVRANRQYNEIEKEKDRIEQLYNEFGSMEISYVDFFIESIDFEIDVLNNLYSVRGIKHKKIDRRKEDLYLLRARLACRFPLMEPESRKRLLIHLSEFGTEEDLIRINNILGDKKESKEIKNICKQVRKSIIKRINKHRKS